MASGDGRVTGSNGRVRLVLLSFLMLFVELMLIRWTVANVVYLSYFTNFVLLASFLGIGVGFLRARARRDGFRLAPLALAALVVFVAAFPAQLVFRAHTKVVVGLFGLPALPIWISLPLIFVGVTAVMATIGEGVARTFATFDALTAYRLDILGSLLGIVTFAAMAFLDLRPIAWAVVITAVLVVLLGRRLARWQLAGIGVFVAVLAAGAAIPHDQWSPYHKVTSLPPSGEASMRIKVNGLPHQAMADVAVLRHSNPFYFYPYRHLVTGRLRNVLIVGAGSGNDVAVALSEGVRHVDAVEIDPVIRSLGERHPDHPYQDLRVTSYIDDGRAFLERTDRRYDLIEFALPDSLIVVTGQSSLRLESYLFTLQAMQSVHDHLTPNGVFTMYNYYAPDVFNRYAATITDAFGHPPCIDHGRFSPMRRQAVLTVGRTASDVLCSTTWTRPVGTNPLIATDDRPFPYMRSRAIPRFYLIALSLILLISVLVVRGFGGPLRQMRSYVDLFFMGAAFLLLETKNVVQFALLFGTTWLVNAMVFAGILVAVFAAVEVARRVRLPGPQPLYACLAMALVVAWMVQPDSLLRLPVVPRFGASVAIAFAPVFLANLVFAQRFGQVGSSTVAFGANLLGAMVGGVLEYGALVVGYRSLLIVVLALYAAAFATNPAARVRDRPVQRADLAMARRA